nr:zinc-binding alcohol dehydrogenase [Chloroflexota bacterium]
IFGLGAIGLFAVQLARLAGACQIFAVEPIAVRRELALGFGADVALDPADKDGDVGRAIRELAISERSVQAQSERIVGGYNEVPTQRSQRGVDVALECAGTASALHQAIRATRFGGTVCVLSYYGRHATGLHLGEEFHINQIRLISARSQSLPLRDAPRWTLSRLTELAMRWLISGKLRTEGIVDPIVAFSDSVAAYRAIDEHPEQAIKLGIRFD